MSGFIGFLAFCIFASLLVCPDALRKRRLTGHSLVNQSANAQEAPGARAQVSQKALDYFGREVLPVLVEEEVPKINIPDLGGTDSGFRWSIRNIRITNPRVERPAFRFAPGQGLLLELNDIKLDLRVSYSAKGDSWWNPISTSGDASCRPTAWASGLVLLGVSAGKPTLSLNPASVRINMGSISIHGSMLGWLVELLIPIFQGDIERELEKALKKVVEDLVNNELNNILSRLDFKVGVPVPPPFDDSGLHFNFTAISAHSEHIAVDLSVAIVDPRNPDRYVKQPVSTTIPDNVDVNKMLSVSVAPEMVEDIVHFHQDKWSHTLQTGDVPPESPLGLDSGSLTLLTTPPLSSLFGQKDMQLTFSLGGQAQVQFGEGWVDLELPSLFKFDIKHDAAEPEHAFTLDAPVDGKAVVRIEPEPNQAIHAELQSLSLTPLTTADKHSSIWFVNTLVISPMLEFLEETIIMPEINKLMRGGVPCCEVDGFALREMTSRISGGVLTVFSDIDLDMRAILR